MSGWHLAQMNIGTMVGPKGDPRVQPFFDALDEINALAEASPGFVWRLTDEYGQNATGITLLRARSDAIHCTTKRMVKNAWAKKPSTTQPSNLMTNTSRR